MEVMMVKTPLIAVGIPYCHNVLEVTDIYIATLALFNAVQSRVNYCLIGASLSFYTSSLVKKVAQLIQEPSLVSRSVTGNAQCSVRGPVTHLNLLLHEESLHHLAVPLIKASVMEPDAELQRVFQIRILQASSTQYSANISGMLLTGAELSASKGTCKCSCYDL